MTPEVKESVTRPIIVDITKQLLDITGLPQDTKLLYPDDFGNAKQPGSELIQENGINTMPYHNRITIEVDDDFDKTEIQTMATYRPENPYIFKDDLLDIYIKQAYSTVNVNINFKYRSVDQVSAEKWRNEVRTRIGMNRSVILHDIRYHYLLSPELLVILKELHRMREAVASYGEDYDTYFKKNVSEQVSLVTNMSGTQTAWGVSESQIFVQGIFDFDGAPEKGSKEGEGDAWTISFNYKFKYDLPVAEVMFYPLMVHNQLVDQKYRPDKSVDTFDKHKYRRSLSKTGFANFESGVKAITEFPGIAIPSFDEFFPSSVPSYTKRVFTALINIDTTNPKNLMNLINIGSDYVFNDKVVNFLKGEIPYLFQHKKSIFNISFYNGFYIVEDKLTIDNDFNIYSKEELSLRNQYHIRFSVVTDLRILSKEALDRLREYGDAMKIILEYIDPRLIGKNIIPTPIKNNYVAKNDLNKIITIVNNHDNTKYDPTKYDPNHIGRQTVQTLIVTAHRRAMLD